LFSIKRPQRAVLNEERGESGPKGKRERGWRRKRNLAQIRKRRV
jgi:hypothetical protein